MSPRDPDDPPTLGHEEVVTGTVGVEVQLRGVVPPAVELHDELGLRVGEVDPTHPRLIGPELRLANGRREPGGRDKSREPSLQLAGRRDVPVTARLEELTHEADAGSPPPPELVGHRP
jgi:hypothetical protein